MFKGFKKKNTLKLKFFGFVFLFPFNVFLYSRVGEVLVNYNQVREDLLFLKTHQFEEESLMQLQPILVAPVPVLRDITNKGSHTQSASVAIITEHLKKGLEVLYFFFLLFSSYSITKLRITKMYFKKNLRF